MPGQDELQHIEAVRRHEDELRRRRASAANTMIEEIRQLRGELESGLAKLVEKSDALRAYVRRNLRGDEDGQALVAFANQHLRLAGALGNGFRRMTAADRALISSKAARLEREQQDEQLRQQLQQREMERKAQTTLSLQGSEGDDFDEVYGEVVNA